MEGLEEKKLVYEGECKNGRSRRAGREVILKMVEWWA
jgi:hypothetical protein